MIIIGAGMAGLLAAQYFRDLSPVILEQNDRQRLNHAAVLRFRTRKVEAITNIPLKAVQLRRAIMMPDGMLTSEQSILASNAYSRKVTGIYTNRSAMNLEPAERYVAPDDFMDQLHRHTSIQYGTNWDDKEWERHEAEQERMGPNMYPVISTIPMRMMSDRLLKNVDGPKPDYWHRSITVAETRFKAVDLHQTVYWPWHADKINWANGDLGGFGEKPIDRLYRMSFTGNRLILEFTGDYRIGQGEIDAIVNELLVYWLGEVPEYDGNYGRSPESGHFRVNIQKYGKIVPMEQIARRHLISQITDRWNIYQLGRFATWRQILLDDVADDLVVIRNLIASGVYGRRHHYSK